MTITTVLPLRDARFLRLIYLPFPLTNLPRPDNGNGAVPEKCIKKDERSEQM